MSVYRLVLCICENRYPDFEKREICLQRKGRLDRFVDSSVESEILPGTKEFARLDATPICRGVDGKSIVRRNNTDRFGESEPTTPENLLDAINSTTCREKRERENYSTFRMRARWMENLRDDEKSTGLHAKIKVYFFVVNFIRSINFHEF